MRKQIVYLAFIKSVEINKRGTVSERKIDIAADIAATVITIKDMHYSDGQMITHSLK